MKVVTNEVLIAKRKKLAGRVATGAMLLLFAGLLTNCYSFRSGPGSEINATIYYLLLGFLLTGFIAAVVSSNLVNRWVKEPRNDQVLSKVLKNFDNSHYLFNYTTNVPHVLLTPHKIFVIAARNHEGRIRCQGNRWQQPFKLRRLFLFTEEGLGNPAAEAEGYVERLRKYLSGKGNGLTIPEIQPVVIFTNPNVELEVEGSTVPAMKGGALKQFVREESKGPSISAQERKTLIEVLSND